MLRIGNSEKSISITIGSTSKSLGRSLFALSTASLTSCKAVLTSTSVLNSTITLELSCTEFELKFLIPFTDLICFSIGLVIKFSISAGEFPGYTVCTMMVGITISGNKDFGIFLYANNPNKVSKMVRINTDVLFLSERLVSPKFLDLLSIA